MDKPQNKFLSVVYQLYSVAENGEKQLEEQTGDERPFEFITGFGISLDRFEEEVSGLEKGEHFDFRPLANTCQRVSTNWIAAFS